MARTSTRSASVDIAARESVLTDDGGLFPGQRLISRMWKGPSASSRVAQRLTITAYTMPCLFDRCNLACRNGRLDAGPF